jgi:hypothetical protein
MAGALDRTSSTLIVAPSSARMQGDMLDSEFWHIYAKEFRELDPGHYLRAECHFTVNGNDPWQIIGTGETGESVRIRFGPMVRRAIDRVATEHAKITVDEWFDLVFKYVHYAVSLAPGGNVYRIMRLCAASADLCCVLEERALEAEGLRATVQTIVVDPLPVLSPIIRKRGRPQTIPDERKQKAIAVKENGGSNKAAAVELYGVRRPSIQQVKNVPTILRHFRQGMKKSESESKKPSKPQ